MSISGKGQRLLQSLRDLLKRLRRKAPGDPYAEKLAPVRRGPSGAAVAEPEEDSYRFFPPRSR